MSSNAPPGAIWALLLHVLSSATSGQLPGTAASVPPDRPAAPAPSAAPDGAATALPAGMPVTIELGESLASSTHKRGDVFPIVLVEPLLLDGIERVAAGTRGTGQVVHAAPARGGGAPGELIIAARTLETPTGPLPLRGFKVGASGDDNSGMALGVSFAAGPFAMFIRGREVVIPEGTRGIARIRAQPRAEPGAAADSAPIPAPVAPPATGPVPALDSDPSLSPTPDTRDQPKE